MSEKKPWEESLPKTRAGRFEMVMDLYAPRVWHECAECGHGHWGERDPAAGVISREDAFRLLDAACEPPDDGRQS